MGEGAVTIFATCVVCVFSATGLLGCGGKADDPVASDAHVASGGVRAAVSYGGMPSSATGGASSTGGALSVAIGGHNATSELATGGTHPVTATVNPICAGMPIPSAKGTLSIASNYVTTGTLKGYGYTFLAEHSNDQTCVVPMCGAAGCSAGVFGPTALCAAGVVGYDSGFTSVAGVGFKLNQSTSGTLDVVPAPSTITVVTTLGPSDWPAANAARVQTRDAAGNLYCVDAGNWENGVPIDVTLFSTTCWKGWDEQHAPLAVGTPIVELDVIVPSDSASERSFSFCITDVVFDYS